ncbi:tetratricopeptide repeat-containing protein EMW1 [Pneumocystis jirovecii RU7]|uniref:TPR repeat-containing protein n=1 Tax=Pneumocystis jirovecii (strain RU7) TaxID=1408657 RepID=A0A0W4ZKZ2_PNEJ7|nr:tetratricopeptide repeat-containing protein EMW1 [Pneumocystis jirovecii RU7]KTW29043.1 hypothetical protein T551_02317 [Pneumocystis jirovecii RU7]
MLEDLKEDDFYKLEWALIKGHDINIQIGQLVRSVIDGDFKTVFSSPEIREILGENEGHVKLPEILKTNIAIYFKDIFSKIPSTLEGELMILLLGISSIHAFIQIHFTGPKPMFDSYILFPKRWETILNKSDFEKNALKCLEIDNVYPYHLIQSPTFLLVSKLAFSNIFKYSKTYLWWRARIDFIHQRILDEHVAVLHDCIFKNMETIAKECEKQEYYIRACYALEIGLYLNYYGRNSISFDFIKNAAKETGLKWILTGFLGRRTKFQTFDISQLVLIAKGENNIEKTLETIHKIPKILDLNDDTLLETISFKPKEVISSESIENDNIPESLKNTDPNNPSLLSPLDACILLALTLFIKNTNPNDGLTMEEMAPYTERVLKHPINWTVYSMALLIRCRLEAGKGRTMERSVLQLQVLVDQLLDDIDSINDFTNNLQNNTSFLRKPLSCGESASVKERLTYGWQLLLLPRWTLEEELANRYLSIGMIKSALEIFERLEIWEKIALCWTALNKENKAIEVLTSQLALEPKNPKLWTLLGDIQRNPSHWIKAWNVSGNRYAKAQRSLGKFYYSEKKFKESAEAFRLSLDINPLNYAAWFTYGCCHLELNNWEMASEAFTRCVSLDPSDGESWNNLALSFLKYNPPKKYDAWNALRQALSNSYESWRIWENYLTISLDIGEWNEVVRSINRCIDLRAHKIGENIIDTKILDILVKEIIKNEYTGKERGFLRHAIDLITVKIPPLITSNPLLWKFVAKINIWRNKPLDALEAYIKSYHIWISKSDINTNKDVWTGTVESAVELIDTYKNFGLIKDHTDNLIISDWKFKAKSILRTLKGKGQMFWTESKELVIINEYLKEFQNI